jgi:hypothetical protein
LLETARTASLRSTTPETHPSPRADHRRRPDATLYPRAPISVEA